LVSVAAISTGSALDRFLARYCRQGTGTEGERLEARDEELGRAKGSLCSVFKGFDLMVETMSAVIFAG